jgi:RNA polymerase sigma-70 factor (ECF subfamily)
MLDGEDKVVSDAVRGKASAFGRLYDHYQPAIYRFVFIKVGQREEAEDLTHRVFLNAWQNISSYRDLGFPFSSWLYHIARNQIIDHYRTNRPAVPLDEVSPDLLTTPEDSVVQIEVRLELDRVRLAIRMLKPDHQDVIIMRFVEELSIKEVAVAIGKSEGAVKLIQHRALRELRRRLTPHDNHGSH